MASEVDVTRDSEATVAHALVPKRFNRIALFSLFSKIFSPISSFISLYL